MIIKIFHTLSVFSLFFFIAASVLRPDKGEGSSKVYEFCVIGFGFSFIGFLCFGLITALDFIWN